MVQTSGKKEGKGGREVFETNNNPNTNLDQCSFLSLPIIIESRELALCLKTPALANIPIDAQP
jgi:hypothetical protein